jgi:hypothetical protein
MTDLPCMQEVPPAEPVEDGDEGEWDTVGEPAGSRSPAPTVEELIAQLERQPSSHQEGTEPAAPAIEEVVAAGAQEGAASVTVAAERGSGCRGARGGARRGWTGGHCQHPRRPGRDYSPVKPVSAELPE